MKKYLIILIILFAVFSCSDDDSFSKIEARLFEPNIAEFVQNATVVLYVQEIENGTFSSSYKEIDRIETDIDGNFSFSFEMNYTTDIKLVMLKEGYFQKTIFIDPNDIRDNSYDNEILFYSAADISIHIKNIHPYDTNDQLTLRFPLPDYQCSQCCSSEQIVFKGDEIDEYFECKTTGFSYLYYEYILIKNGNPLIHSDSVFCEPFITTNHNLHY